LGEEKDRVFQWGYQMTITGRQTVGSDHSESRDSSQFGIERVNILPSEVEKFRCSETMENCLEGVISIFDED
jgi:hypothetical protein